MDNYKADDLIESVDSLTSTVRELVQFQSRFLEVLERAYPPALAPVDEFHTYQVTRPNGMKTTFEARTEQHAAMKVWDAVGSIFEPRSNYKVERLD